MSDPKTKISFTVDGDRSSIVHTLESYYDLSGESLPTHFAALPRKEDYVESDTGHKAWYGEYRLKLYVFSVTHSRGRVRVHLIVESEELDKYIAVTGRHLE